MEIPEPSGVLGLILAAYLVIWALMPVWIWIISGRMVELISVQREQLRVMQDLHRDLRRQGAGATQPPAPAPRRSTGVARHGP